MLSLIDQINMNSSLCISYYNNYAAIVLTYKSHVVMTKVNKNNLIRIYV